MTERSWPQRLREVAARHEHALIAAWIVGAVAVFAVLGVWGIALGGAEGAVRALDQRWIGRLERGEELVDQQRWDEAEAYLAELDREFPARTATHKLDKERERLLAALGATYLAQGRKRRTLETLRALVEFDPRNWVNHATLAAACEQLGEDDEAAEAWDRVLAIQPANWTATRARIAAAADGGDYAAVPPLYEQYLDALLLAGLSLQLADGETLLEVPVDGRFHELDVPFAATADGRARLALDTAGFSIELDWLELVPARTVGSARRAGPVRWYAPLPAPAESEAEGDDAATGDGSEDDAPRDAAPPQLQGLDPLGTGRYAARGPSTTLHADLPFDGPVARVRARLRLFKPLDAELWAAVEKSYRNVLAFEALRAAQERSVVGGSAQAIAALAD